jgi:hypothetical protein
MERLFGLSARSPVACALGAGRLKMALMDNEPAVGPAGSASGDAANDETREAPEVFFRVLGDEFRLTEAGKARYGERFGRVGINVEQVRSLDAFEQALRSSYRAEEAALNGAMMKKRYSDKLEARLLRAIATGNEAEMQRATELLRRRRSLGLRVVTSGSS